jgi:hypothetical protein
MRRLPIAAALAAALTAAATTAAAPAAPAARTALAPATSAARAATSAPAEHASSGGPTPYAAAVHLARTIGARPAASAGELRAQRHVAAAFRAAGLRIGWERFTVPGRGRSRDLIGIVDTPARCLTILMAHADTGPGLPGANDNASGVGVVTALAARLAATRPPCDAWLVVTGAEERFVTGTPDHLGASALVRRVTRLNRRGDLRIALSLDEVGRGGRFFLQSPHARARPSVEGRVLAGAREAGARVRFAPDSGTGNSDHREFELSGLPAAKLGPWNGAEPCRHRPCDTWRLLDRGTLDQALEIAARVAGATP